MRQTRLLLASALGIALGGVACSAAEKPVAQPAAQTEPADSPSGTPPAKVTGGPTPAPAGALTSADQDVYCHSAYRRTISVSPRRGPRIKLREDGDRGVNRWKHLAFHAAIEGEFPEKEGTVHVAVWDRGSRRTVMAGMYQAPAGGFVNGFEEAGQKVRGQGFTGLIYAVDSDSRAEIQFVCRAVPEP